VQVQCIVRSNLTCLKSLISVIQSAALLKGKSDICRAVRNVLKQAYHCPCVQVLGYHKFLLHFSKAYKPLMLLTGGVGELLETDIFIDSPVLITLRSL
jgi:hypothetical protein